MKLLDKLNIPYHNIKLYEIALTHTSYANEHDLVSYERLEYLGDAILEFIMSEYLYNKINYNEGEMTKLRSRYVCEQALYEYSLKLGINEYIKLGNSHVNDGKYNKAIVADVFEALLAAIYLDNGMDVAKDYIYKYIIPIIENDELDIFKDYKSKLQEMVQTTKKSLEYVLTKEIGPSHLKTFSFDVMIDGIKYGSGTAHSKKEAEQRAAKDALDKAMKGEF